LSPIITTEPNSYDEIRRKCLYINYALAGCDNFPQCAALLILSLMG
jgi:hypothetical protein